MQISTEIIRAALNHIDPNIPRDDWVKIGMAIKSEYPDESGYALFNDWSSQGQNYSEKSTQSTWKSFKSVGGIGVASLLHQAQAKGFDLVAHHPSDKLQKPSAKQQAKEQAERKAIQAALSQSENERSLAKHEQVAEQALKRFCAGSIEAPEGVSTYPQRKGVKTHSLRFEKDATALLPLRDASDKLWNLQTLAPTKPPSGSDKLFLKGGRKSGLFSWVNPEITPIKYAETATICIAEGFATAASVYEALELPTVCALDAGNLAKVAQALHEKYPQALIVIAGDDDFETAAKGGANAGREKAIQAAKTVGGLVVFPQGLQAGESDFNDLHSRLGLEAVGEQLMQAIQKENERRAQKASETKQEPHESNDREDSRYSLRDSGVWFTGKDHEGRDKAPIKICSRLEVSAGVRDFDSAGFGFLLEFKDPLGRFKHWALPARMLSGDGNEYRAALLSMGLRIEAGSAAKNHLTSYIQSRTPKTWAFCTDRTGWHKVENQAVYVQPRHTFGDKAEHRVIFQSDQGTENTLSKNGSLALWQKNIAAPCAGNSRLVFALSCAFAGLCMKWLGSESGGFHYRGDSSSGKTTALRVAASVFGSERYLQRWRATDNALEAIAAQHCDSLLILDELAQVESKQAGEIAYMLGNGVGKQRASRAALPKPILRWNLLFLSAGELGLAQHVAESGKNIKAGQEVRMVDISADAGAGYGAFECLHQSQSPQAFSDALLKACSRTYGTAAPTFIEWLVTHQSGLTDRLGMLRDEYAQQFIPNAAAGQVQRVGMRFALVAAAGELATLAGITLWQAGEAAKAAKTCFDAWIEQRGGLGNAEERKMISQVRHFFALHGAARFTWWQRAADDHAPNVMNQAGFKRMVTANGQRIKKDSDHQREFGEKIQIEDAETTTSEFFVLPEVFENEICKGFECKSVARLLRERGYLEGDKSGFTRRERLPTLGLTRCYKILSSIMEGED